MRPVKMRLKAKIITDSKGKPFLAILDSQGINVGYIGLPEEDHFARLFKSKKEHTVDIVFTRSDK